MFSHVMPVETAKEIIERVLDGIRPALRRDGGDVEFVAVADGVVSLRLSGACATCGMSALTVKFGLEPAIKNAVPEVTSVVVLKDSV
jgi:Fe-S cluster biogenesis protein NfuA